MTFCLRLISGRLWKSNKLVLLRSIRRSKERECDVLRNKLRVQRLYYESEIARLKAQYKDEITKIEHNKFAHKASPESEEEEMKLGISEVVARVKERFSKHGAEEVSMMLFRFAFDHDCLTKETYELIDGIVPAVMQRNKPQNNVNIKKAGQVNINPKKVITN